MAFRKTGVKIDICPVCEAEREIQEGFKSEVLHVRGEPIKIQAHVEHCPICSEFFADVETEEENFQKAYREYRKRHDLLQPEEIRDIRLKYGISQRLFGRLLGWGEITLHRYESGAVQDETHNAELLLMREPENFRTLFERYRNKLKSRTVEKIELRLDELSSNPFGRCIEFFSSVSRSQADIYSGFKQFDYEKLKNVIVFFAQKRTPRLFKTKLNKLLWYFDFICYKENRVSATGCIYVHLPYGPVPENYELYLADLIHDEILDVEEVTFGRENDVAGEAYSALTKPNLSVFSKEEIRCLERVQQFFGSLTSKRISEYSHNEDGYKNTKNGEKISYEYADKIEIS